MEANWKPLESRVGRTRCAGFMFMGRVGWINLYIFVLDIPAAELKTNSRYLLPTV